MHILVTGATGLVGHHLIAKLFESGHKITVVSRNKSSAQKRLAIPCEIIGWNPATEDFPLESLKTVDAVVNLAGESLAEGFWTTTKLKNIYDSRIQVTKKLAKALAMATSPRPQVFISASAIGYYGNRGDEVLTENSLPGDNFLAEVCKDWENEALKAAQSLRTVTLRTGIVLDKSEGAVPKMTTPFKIGLGSVVGSGNQWMSWIHIDDLVGIIIWALQNNLVQGPINAVAPEPVTNRVFSQRLAQVLHKPLLLKMPSFVFQFLLGKKSQLLLDSQNVSSQKVLDAGFKFRFGYLNGALSDILTH